MRHSSGVANGAVGSSAFGRLGQQILEMFDHSAERAALRREMSHLDRHLLEDVGLTPADVEVHLQDLYANDFRVAHIVARRAA